MLVEKMIYCLLGLAAVIWGFFLCYRSVKNIILFRNIKTFPSVMGTILSTQIITFKCGDNPDSYYPEVQYEYVVDGVSYESEGVGFISESEPSIEKAQGILNMYPKFSQVRVYYKPENPKLSALKYSNITGYTSLWAIGGAIIFSGGVVFLLVGVIL